MAIYHLSMKIIGGNSGRTAVGAAAYRTGEKLHNEHDGITHDYTHRRGATGAAAYRSGGRLNDSNGAHDFTRKSGIVYSEIMLPKYAPLKYQDRETLWNAVEKSEKQHNARTAREIVVALPNELTTEQHIKLLQDYIKRNFVDEGMCADFSIHSGHKGTEHTDKMNQDKNIKKNNPHAHIMLTVRPINADGTWGAKSKKEYILDKYGQKIKLKSGEWKSRKIDTTNWDKRESLLKWREDWAITVNRELKLHGFNERIDHRTLEVQGIDRRPTIHLGHEAHNLEKRGIKTRIGDINRKIERDNAEVERINAKILILEEQKKILEKQREINRRQAEISLKTNVQVRESVRVNEQWARSEPTRPSRERPSRDRPERDRFSRDIERGR